MGNGTSAVGNQSNQINIRQSPPPSSNDTGATGGVNQTTQQRGKVVTWLRKVTGKEARAITERTHNAIDNLAQRTFQEYGVESSAELVLHTLGDKMPDGKQIKDRTVRANVLERVTERGIKQVEMQNSTIASRAQGLADLDEAGVMTDAQLEALTQVGILATDIDEAVLHSDRTLSILDEGHQLSGEDMENVQTSLAAAKYNLARLPAALEKLKQENPDPALGKYVDRLQQDLINRHMEVADMMCKYDLDEAPPMSGVSRGDRIEANILQATAALKVAQGLDVPGLTAEGKQEIVGALQDHLQELKLAKDMTTGGPTEDSVAQDTDLLEELASTKFALGGKKKKKADPKAMEALQKRWNEQASSTNENKSWLPVTDSKVSQPDMLKAFMQHRLKAAGVKKEAMPDLKAQFKKGVNEARNERNWNPIESTLQFSVGDKTVKVQSTITPASNFSQHFAADYEKNGVNCFERMQGEHVPNLAHTELKDESGKTVFSGLRHGILDSYEISAGSLQKLPDSELREMVDKYLNPAEKHTYDSTDTENIPEAKLESRADTVDGIVKEIRSDKKVAGQYALQMRENVSKNMAEELVTAALVTDPGKFQQALDGEEVDISLNSLSLVTSHDMGPLTGAKGDERKMQDIQSGALKSLADRGAVQLQVRDKEGQSHQVTVNVKVRNFNFGVNSWAIGKSSGLSRAIGLSGWNYTMQRNNPELEDLLGPRGDSEFSPDSGVGQALSKLDEQQRELNFSKDVSDPQQRAELETETAAIDQRRGALLKYAGEAKQIWRDGSYAKGGAEPYKMVSRLGMVIGTMEGETLAFNCKSGKDRTGQLDAELKFMSAVGNVEPDSLPKPGDASPWLRDTRSKFTLGTGNLEMQALNTGLPGFKLKGVAGLSNYYDSEGQKSTYRGGSSHVES